LKKNIQELSIDALATINLLRPVTFEWKKAIDNGMTGTQMGFLAQELEQVLPSMVVTRNDTIVPSLILDPATSEFVTKNDTVKGKKSVKYTELFPLFIKAVQEQQVLIEALTTELAAVNARIIALEGK